MSRPFTPRTNGKAERFIQTALREWAYACRDDGDQPVAAGVEGAGAIAAPVISEHAPDRDAELPVVGEGIGEEGGSGVRGLVGVELGEGDAGMVVHAHMDVFPAGARTGAAAVSGHAVVGTVKPAEFLGVEVQQIVGVRVFVPADGRRRLEGAEAGQSPAAEHSTDGSGRDPDGGGNLRAGPAETAQRHDLGGDRQRHVFV